MNRIKVRQLWLPFCRETHWDQLPENSRRQCQELLSHLLREVVVAERKRRSVHDESREDQTVAS